MVPVRFLFGRLVRLLPYDVIKTLPNVIYNVIWEVGLVSYYGSVCLLKLSKLCCNSRTRADEPKANVIMWVFFLR